jgi:hypothetical protein
MRSGPRCSSTSSTWQFHPAYPSPRASIEQGTAAALMLASRWDPNNYHGITQNTVQRSNASMNKGMHNPIDFIFDGKMQRTPWLMSQIPCIVRGKRLLREARSQAVLLHKEVISTSHRFLSRHLLASALLSFVSIDVSLVLPLPQ